MRTKQLSFLLPSLTEHGGDSARGRRKTKRPFDPRRPVHVTVRSSRARGTLSLLARGNKWRVYGVMERTARRYGIRVFRYANVGNQVHLLIQARTRADFQGFLREFTGVVAVMMTGAVKGSPAKFWDGLAWSKIVNWGRQFRNAARYILLNVMESLGRRDRTFLSKLEKDGVVAVGTDPGS